MDEANINDIDEYITYYYEENIEHKIAVTRKILLLTLDFKNIEILLNHGIFWAVKNIKNLRFTHWYIEQNL